MPIVFFTDGDLDMDDSQKADLLSFVRDDGKGFIGIHSATITFLSWPDYGKMIGGYFDGHPWGEFDAPLVVEDAGFPGMSHLPRVFTLKDEIYQIKDFSRDNVRVLLRLDAGKIDLSRKGVRRKDGDFAVIWARNYGKGRVLYNGLGHRREVWDRPDIQRMWLEMVQWSMGLKSGDATSSSAAASSHLPQRAIAAEPPEPQFVDLSLLVAPEYPCTWPTFPRFQITRAEQIGPRSAYNSDILIIDGNTGTQLDVPPHSVTPPIPDYRTPVRSAVRSRMSSRPGSSVAKLA